MPPPLALSKGSPSSNSYTSKKARRTNWFNHFKAYKKADTEDLLKGYELKKESKPFLLTIKSLSNIPMQDVGGPEIRGPISGGKYQLEYYVTFFNKDIGTSGNFYGRTYRSKPLPLKEVGGAWDVVTEEFIYFHTSYTEKSSFVVVECVVAKDLGGIKSFGSIGYALCSVFENFGPPVTIELMKGSPRSIG